MASPHIAGAVAVIKQAKPKWSVEQIKAAIMNTAVTLKDSDGEVYPHNAQGAGSARIMNAIKADIGSSAFNPRHPETGCCDGVRICDRRRPCASHRM